MKGLKICGVSDPKTLNYILNHHQRPTMIGFISNYKKSRRFIEYEKLSSDQKTYFESTYQLVKTYNANQIFLENMI